MECFQITVRITSHLLTAVSVSLDDDKQLLNYTYSD